MKTTITETSDLLLVMTEGCEDFPLATAESPIWYVERKDGRETTMGRTSLNAGMRLLANEQAELDGEV